MQNRMLINNEFYDVSQTVLQLNFQKKVIPRDRLWFDRYDDYNVV